MEAIDNQMTMAARYMKARKKASSLLYLAATLWNRLMPPINRPGMGGIAFGRDGVADPMACNILLDFL